MIAKTVLSVLAVGVTIVGLLMAFNSQGYLVFIIGFVAYFILSVSGNIGKRISESQK
jgi:hypothetical protein